MKTKSDLRKYHRQRRQQTPVDQRARKSQAIAKQLLQSIDWSAVVSLHIYDSRPDWGEVDTGRIIDYLATNHPTIKLDIAKQSSDDDYPEATYDLIIVPVLAYDDAKHRLGMGKGWYDRFLATQPDAHKIGLAYYESRVDKLPIELHDIVLDEIISA